MLNPEYIADYLDKGEQQVAELMQLLQDERDCISCNDAIKLAHITQNKQQLAQEIHTHTQQCEHALQQAGFGNDNNSLRTYIERCAKPLLNRWQSLQALLKQCQTENRINGKLLINSQRRIKQALAILQGKPVEEDLYGKAGQALTESSGNSLTHA